MNLNHFMFWIFLTFPCQVLSTTGFLKKFFDQCKDSPDLALSANHIVASSISPSNMFVKRQLVLIQWPRKIFQDPTYLSLNLIHAKIICRIFPTDARISLQYFEEHNPSQAWSTIAQNELSKKVRHLKLDITDLIRPTLNINSEGSTLLQFRLVLSNTDSGANFTFSDILDIKGESRNEGIRLVLQFSKCRSKPVIRTEKREISSKDISRSDTRCHLASFNVSSTELPFQNQILLPRHMNIGRCLGICAFENIIDDKSLMSNHAKIKMILSSRHDLGAALEVNTCVPVSYKSQALLWLTPTGDIQIFSADSFAVTACGCR